MTTTEFERLQERYFALLKDFPNVNYREFIIAEGEYFEYLSMHGLEYDPRPVGSTPKSSYSVPNKGEPRG